MAAGDAGLGTAVTITGATSGKELLVTDLGWSGYSRGVVDVTTKDNTNSRTFISTLLVDPGELTVTLLTDEETPSSLPAISAAAEVWTIASRGKTFACSGFVSDVSYSWPTEDVNTTTFTIKLSGDVTLPV